MLTIVKKNDEFSEVTDQLNEVKLQPGISSIKMPPYEDVRMILKSWNFSRLAFF